MWQANRQGRQLHSAAAERLGRTLDQPCGDVDPGHSIAGEMGHIHGVKSLQLSLRFTSTNSILPNWIAADRLDKLLAVL